MTVDVLSRQEHSGRTEALDKVVARSVIPVYDFIGEAAKQGLLPCILTASDVP